MSRFARGKEHTIYGTSHEVWITPLLGEEVAKTGEADAPDMSTQAVIARHTFRTIDHAAAEFESADQVLEELDWQQMDDLAGAILAFSGLGKELATAQATFQDGSRQAQGLEPAPDGAPVRSEA